MRPSKPRISNEAFSYSSYILIQMVNNNPDDNPTMALAGETSKTINFSVSTLILPAKSPLLITAAYYMFNLLSNEETNDLLNQRHTKLDSARLRSKIRFYLYNNEKVSVANENNHENYVELEPLCMLYPKDLAENYREVFNPTSDPTNSFTQKSVSEKEKNNTSQDLKKFFTVLVLHPIRANLLTGKFKEEQILNVSETLVPGQALFLMSSPFAFLSPILYKNIVNVVNISKVAQIKTRGVFKKSKRNYLFIIDHTYKEGEEGSPIFNEFSQVVGILLGNMAPSSSELAGFSVCLSISCIVDLLSMLSFHHNTHDVWRLTISRFKPFVQSLPLRSLYPRIVKIFTGSGLGSGVLLNSAGLVLTNKHVIENILGKTIVVEINYNHQNDYEHYDATLFQASEGNIDVALLKLTSKLSDKALKAIKSTERFLDHPVDVRYLHGKEVYAMGYTFNEMRALDLRATVTKGHLSKVIAYKNIPFLIATTCPVYNGFSGGAIVSNRGEFLGLITYSFKNNKKGNPNNLNFSYSCNMFKEMIGLVDLRDDDNIKDLDMWKKTDGYVEKMATSQVIEYVPCFDFKPSL